MRFLKIHKTASLYEEDARKGYKETTWTSDGINIQFTEIVLQNILRNQLC